MTEIGGVNILEPSEIQQQASATTYRRTRQLASDVNEGFYAVFISCPEWNSADYIQALGEDLDCPVVADIQAGLERVPTRGDQPAHNMYGELLERA